MSEKESGDGCKKDGVGIKKTKAFKVQGLNRSEQNPEGRPNWICVTKIGGRGNGLKHLNIMIKDRVWREWENRLEMQVNNSNCCRETGFPVAGKCV